MSGFNSPISTLGGSSFLGPNFSPLSVSEIAIGYWWRASSSTGIGTTGFRVIEQNGHSSFDLVQPTIASQPTLLSEAGSVQFRMRNAANANPSLLGTAAVQVNWTGPTYIGGWFRFPAGCTGNYAFFQHTTGVANQGRINLSGGATPNLNITCSSDGITANIKSNTHNAPTLANLGWHWCEGLFIGTGATDSDKAQVLIDFNALTRVGGTSPMVTSLFNATAPIGVACRLQNALANVDTTDWATVYYGNGIPSLANRKLLANFYNPSGVLVI